jgi:putative oxidoreductase
MTAHRTTVTSEPETTARHSTTVVRPVRRPIDLQSTTYVFLRVGAGILFFQHGAQKLLGWFGGMGGEGATAPLFSLMGLAGVLELVGGVLLVLGLFVVPVAVVLTIEMLAAYAIAHMPQGGWPIQNQGELALLYALVFAFFAAHGAGTVSLDRWIERRPGADR